MLQALRVPPTTQTLGAVELTSIAQGYRITDVMMKKAPCLLLEARAYCPGKFLVVVSGDLASVEESVQAAIDFSASSMFAWLLIPDVEQQVVAAINRRTHLDAVETVGVVESFSAAAILDAANAAAKTAEVTIESVNLLQGLGGKAYALFAGDLTDVQAAVAAATTRIPADMRIAEEVIPRFSSDIVPFLPGVE